MPETQELVEGEIEEVDESEEELDSEQEEELDSEDEESDEEDFMDPTELLARVLVSTDGVTIADSINNMAKQLEVQNKVLIKILSTMKGDN